MTAQDNSKHGQGFVEPIALVLREACNCNKCVDPIDHQRYFVWAELPSNITASTCDVDANGDHNISWGTDIPGHIDHVSHYTNTEIAQLGQRCTLPATEFGPRLRRLWDASNFDTAKNTVSYQDYINDDNALARVLHLVSRDGLAFIDDVPGDVDSVKKMAERVGPLRTTFYGETWDVKTMPEATNVAYTSRYLGFHMDMLYVREPPGLQFMHCIENSCTGGESRFADTFRAADELISRVGKGAFDTLESMNVVYHYRRPGISVSAIKPIFDTVGHESKPPNDFTNAKHPYLVNKLHRIYWSPPFTGRAFGNDENDDVVSQLRASKPFHEILEESASYIKAKVPAGTCAVFDNFRIVHAREAFDLNSGNRWLRVAYVDDSDFQSRTSTLQDKMPLDI